MLNNNQKWNLFNLFIYGFTGFYVFLLVFHEQQAYSLIDEDWIVEWLQVIMFAIAALLFILTGIGLKANAYIRSILLILGLACLFLVGEELSWGQRLFDNNALSFLKKYNAQNETNLHNFRPFQRYRHWLLMFFGIAGMIYSRIKILELSENTLGKLVYYFQPSIKLIPLFILTFISGLASEISYIIREVSNDQEMAQQIHMKLARSTEMGELYCSIATCLYALIKYLRMKFDS